MGLAIFLRKRATTNQFRNLLIGSISTGLGDSALLCSGFFQENFKKNKYKVTTDGNLRQILKKRNIKLTTVGIHNSSWLTSYRNFRDSLVNAKVNVTAKVTYKYHWHAKIFILKKKNKPIFGIIGSSNMTRNAFGLSMPFNYEADVVLWVDGFKKFDKLFKSSVRDLNDFSGEVIIADYDSQKNFGLTIEQRLQQLNDDVEKTELKDLE